MILGGGGGHVDEGDGVLLVHVPALLDGVRQEHVHIAPSKVLLIKIGGK